jgi:hypothetical protein
MSASTPSVQRGLGTQQIGLALGAGALALAIAGAALLGRLPVTTTSVEQPAAVAPAHDQGWVVDNTISGGASTIDHGTSIDTVAPAGEHGSGGSNGTRFAR